jgi:hypothetical protein
MKLVAKQNPLFYLGSIRLVFNEEYSF